MEHGYYLYYFGMRQPALRNFNLSDGTFRIDVIDTWNMTIETVAEKAIGLVCVEMPTMKYLAVQIRKNLGS